MAPTTDRAAISAALDVLSPQAGTALGDGVAAAVKILVSNLAASGVYQNAGEFLPGAIVLESDGAQNRGTVTPFAAASVAKAAGVRIYGVALGTPLGTITQGAGLLKQTIPVPPDPGAVALLAHDSGGQAFAATDATSLNAIYRSLGLSIAHRKRDKDITSWFELAAAVLPRRRRGHRARLGRRAPVARHVARDDRTRDACPNGRNLGARLAPAAAFQLDDPPGGEAGAVNRKRPHALLRHDGVLV